WSPPVRSAAPVVDGLVITSTFSRLVAYSVGLLFLRLLNLSVPSALGLFDRGRDSSLDLAVGIAFVAVDCLYFVGLWTSGWKATLGMRLLRLRLRSCSCGGRHC